MVIRTTGKKVKFVYTPHQSLYSAKDHDKALKVRKQIVDILLKKALGKSVDQ